METLIPRSAFLALCLVLPALHARTADTAREQELAKRYAFAACVIQRYPGTPLADEAEQWAGVLVERGSIPGTFYPRLNDYVTSAVPEARATPNGSKMNLEACVEFMMSKQLTVKVRGLLSGARRAK